LFFSGSVCIVCRTMQQQAKKEKTQPPDTKTAPLALAVETSGREGSAAIGIDDNILVESPFSGRLRHSAELFPAVVRILEGLGRKPRDIRQVYLPSGPGSFTGLRIAVTFGKMLHFATSADIVAVNTLDVLAENASEYIENTGIDADRIAAILDAKRNLFYIALFERSGSGWRRLTEDMLISAEKFLEQLPKTEPTWLLGEGLLYHSKAFLSPHTKLLEPEYWPARARCVYRLARTFARKNSFADPVAITPTYIRKPDVLLSPDEPGL